jgi:serine/threonine protein kinase/tetratricopeptide (TPR) repeat protein
MSESDRDVNADLSREEALFILALAKPAEKRADFLDGACLGDPTLRKRLEALLAAHDRTGPGLDGPTKAAIPTIKLDLADGSDESVGQTLGRYKLLERVGEGGCGVVYVAEQTEPVRRRVALKVIKLGMDTKQVVARFEAERQALAMMDHPNIAKVLDAGSTDTGRPFFVMELVRGIRITEYCDQNNLSTKERLDLFIKVCQAIQHAHQKGIIHRDIKPSNILVTMHDGVPIPKVIDFGIAKATESRLTDATVYTQLHQFIGTPAYMSPEQAEMSGLDIDTRSDIYSLGVLLYELLAGSTPFDAKELMASGIDAMRKAIREKEPMRPSTRLATLKGEELTTTAKRRSAEAPKLIHLLKGDLDWIVMKCLEKDRTRRYETANGLAADLKRHLTNEPVVARPPSTAYRFQKMVRRNRVMATAVVVIALTLVFALGFSTVAYIRERNARLALAAAERAKDEARHRADAENIRAETVANFLTGFFDTVMPDLDQHGHHEAIKRLLEGAEQLASKLTNSPFAEAQVRSKIGDGYLHTLHDYSPAYVQYRAVGKLASALGDPGRHLLLDSRFALTGGVMWEHQDPNAALQALAIGKEAMTQNPPDTKVAASSLAEVASFQSYYGSANQAEELAREALHWDRTSTVAWIVLLRLSYARGSNVEAEQSASNLLALVHPVRPDDLLAARASLYDFLFTIRDADPFVFPQHSLEEALKNLPSNEQLVRGHFQALLGASIARDGSWQKGLSLLVESVSNAVYNVRLWKAATELAALAGDSEIRRSLSISGLGLFAGDADPETSRLLAESMLIFPPDPAFLPAIRRLLDKSFQGAPWTQVLAKLPRSLMACHQHNYAEAEKVIGEYLREGPPILGKGSEPSWAAGWFLRAAIEMRLGRANLARDAYDEGLRFHSDALRVPGKAYTGADWGEACAAELLRRQAEALLGDAVPNNSKGQAP